MTDPTPAPEQSEPPYPQEPTMEPTTTSDGGGDVATKPVESLTTRPVANVDEPSISTPRSCST